MSFYVKVILKNKYKLTVFLSDVSRLERHHWSSAKNRSPCASEFSFRNSPALLTTREKKSEESHLPHFRGKTLRMKRYRVIALESINEKRHQAWWTKFVCEL